MGKSPLLRGQSVTAKQRELLWPRHSVHGAIRKEEKAAEILKKKNPKPYLIRVGNKELM